MKICSKCKKKKHEIEFDKDKHTKSGFRSHCKTCRKLYKTNNKIEISYYNKVYRFNRLIKEFSITKDDYNKLFEEQKGNCAICGRHQSEFKMALSIDHDHTTGRIRGLLCHICNTGLGMFKDQKDLLEKAIKYLEGE